MISCKNIVDQFYNKCPNNLFNVFNYETTYLKLLLVDHEYLLK